MKLTFDFSGKTLLRDWWRQVQALFEETENAVNAEENSRISGDNTLKGNIDSETAERINADNVLRNNINTEVSELKTAVGNAYDKAVEGVDSAAEVQTNLNNETLLRENADSVIEQRLRAEISARTGADNTLDARVTAVEDKAHTHGNKTVLDTITADDIKEWNGIKEQVTETELNEEIAAEKSERAAADSTLQANIDAHTDYANEVISGLLTEIQLLYGLIGVTVYDGGLFTQEEDGVTLDGGAFADTDLTAFDCGGFEPVTVGTLEGVDGGTY